MPKWSHKWFADRFAENNVPPWTFTDGTDSGSGNVYDVRRLTPFNAPGVGIDSNIVFSSISAPTGTNITRNWQRSEGTMTRATLVWRGLTRASVNTANLTSQTRLILEMNSGGRVVIAVQYQNAVVDVRIITGTGSPAGPFTTTNIGHTIRVAIAGGRARLYVDEPDDDTVTSVITAGASTAVNTLQFEHREINSIGAPTQSDTAQQWTDFVLYNAYLDLAPSELPATAFACIDDDASIKTRIIPCIRPARIPAIL